MWNNFHLINISFTFKIYFNRTVLVAFCRVPLFYSYVCIPPSVWSRDWAPHIRLDMENLTLDLPVIPSSYLHDEVIFEQFLFRCSNGLDFLINDLIHFCGFGFLLLLELNWSVGLTGRNLKKSGWLYLVLSIFKTKKNSGLKSKQALLWYLFNHTCICRKWPYLM